MEVKEATDLSLPCLSLLDTFTSLALLTTGLLGLRGGGAGGVEDPEAVGVAVSERDGEGLSE